MTDAVDRVMKLVALAASDSRGEASNAALKACELIRRHGLAVVEKAKAGTAPFNGPFSGVNRTRASKNRGAASWSAWKEMMNEVERATRASRERSCYEQTHPRRHEKVYEDVANEMPRGRTYWTRNRPLRFVLEVEMGRLTLSCADALNSVQARCVNEVWGSITSRYVYQMRESDFVHLRAELQHVLTRELCKPCEVELKARTF